jgi:hypothetical protein
LDNCGRPSDFNVTRTPTFSRVSSSSLGWAATPIQTSQAGRYSYADAPTTGATAPRPELTGACPRSGRGSGGLDVTLLWDRSTRSLTLELVDHSLRRIVDFDAPLERASYVFHHPFAYAHGQPHRDRPHAA